MSLARLAAPAALALACAGPCGAVDVSGSLRPQYLDQAAAARGPLAAADDLAPGIAPLPRSGPEVYAELRASGYGLTGVAAAQLQRKEGDRWRERGWLDELYWSGGRGDWQFSAGKKIVAWDVGYAFRPNDVVEQEPRRLLLETTPEGRPLLLAERFDASTAWSFVVVNPTHPRSARGAGEPALAARVYRRDGALDWHGFGRVGARTGASVGAAVAWVASESLELHASGRWLHTADSLAIDSEAVAAAPGGVVRVDPWANATLPHPVQALVGGTWTNIEQFSILAEAWWDGAALSNAQWSDWNLRNRSLARLVGTPAPTTALAGNLAWQADAFGAATSLRRGNVYLRASWQHNKWQPALDILYTPADAGHVVTGSLGWQGDRVRFDVGVRVYGGPSDAVLAQVPTRRTAYVAGTWSF
ncbi:MAG: hypothetical protein ACXWCV_19045 [Caldimonas sp.]